MTQVWDGQTPNHASDTMTLSIFLILMFVLLGALDILGTEDIGAAQTYTDIATWEGDIPADITADQIYTGQCLGELFDEQVIIDGHTTDVTHYIVLKSKSGSEHDGRANAVSGAGNARITEPTDGWVINPRDDYTRIEWLEAYATDDGGNCCVALSAASNVLVQHLVVHCDG